MRTWEKSRPDGSGLSFVPGSWGWRTWSALSELRRPRVREEVVPLNTSEQAASVTRGVGKGAETG